jgi:hypothetical protein
MTTTYLPEREEDDGLDGEEFENRIVGPQEILRGEVEDDQGVQGQRDAHVVDDGHVQVALPHHNHFISFLPVFRICIHLIRIRIRHFRVNTVPIRIQGFDDQKLEKIYSWKKTYFFFIKIYDLPIPRAP